VTLLACLILVLSMFIGAGLVVFPAPDGRSAALTMRWLGKQPAGQLIATRAELNALLVDQIQGLADLLVFDQAAHSARACSA